MFDGQFYPGQPIQYMDGLLNPIIGVNQYKTFFSEYTAGTQPSDWTNRYVTGGFTFVVQTVAGSLGGQALRWTKTTANRQAISWDRVPSSADVEILIRARKITAGTAGSDNIIGPYARGSGAAGTETGYRMESLDISTNQLWAHSCSKYVSGAATAIGGSWSPGPVGANMSTNAWFWCRFRVNGTTLSRKAWLYGQTEPGTYDTTDTDSAISTAGWVGLQQVTNNPNCEIDYYSVGLNGEVAPDP